MTISKLVSGPMAKDMSSVCRVVTLAAVAIFLALPAGASDGTLQLQNPLAVAKDAAAMPRIASPSGRRGAADQRRAQAP